MLINLNLIGKSVEPSNDMRVISELIRDQENRFNTEHTHIFERSGDLPEKVEISIEYEICGIAWDEKRKMNRFFVRVHEVEPFGHLINCDIANQMVSEIRTSVPELKGDFHVTIDLDSVKNVNGLVIDSMDPCNPLIRKSEIEDMLDEEALKNIYLANLLVSTGKYTKAIEALKEGLRAFSPGYTNPEIERRLKAKIIAYEDYLKFLGDMNAEASPLNC